MLAPGLLEQRSDGGLATAAAHEPQEDRGHRAAEMPA